MFSKPISRADPGVAEKRKIMLSLVKGKNGRNNYPEWVDYSIDTHGSVFGLLARVMKTNVAYVVPAVFENEDEIAARFFGQIK